MACERGEAPVAGHAEIDGQRQFEIVRERRVDQRRLYGGCRGRVQRIPAVRVHRVNAVVIERVHGEVGVDKDGGRLVGDGANQRGEDVHGRVRGAVDLVALERALGVGGPGEPGGVRGHLIGHDRRHRGQSLRDRDVVEVPAVRHVGGVGGQAEPDQDSGPSGVGRQGQAPAHPAARRAGVGGQDRPARAAVGRDLHVSEVAAGERVRVRERDHGVHGRQEAHRRGQGKRLPRDAVGIAAARRVGPGVRRGCRALGGQRPGRVRHPRPAAGLTVVKEGIIHADFRGRVENVAEGEEPAHVHNHDLVVVAGLGRGGDVHKRGDVLRGDRTDQDAVLPRLADHLRTVDPVGREVADERRVPGQRHGVGGLRRPPRGQRGRRVADVDVIHVKAVLDHRGVRHEMETHLERRAR